VPRTLGSGDEDVGEECRTKERYGEEFVWNIDDAYVAWRILNAGL